MRNENTDEFGDLCEEKAQQLTEILKDDLKWLIKTSDYGFDPNTGADAEETDDGTGIHFVPVVPTGNTHECTTCIVGRTYGALYRCDTY